MPDLSNTLKFLFIQTRYEDLANSYRTIYASLANWKGILLMGLVTLSWAVMELVIQYIPGNYSLYQVIWVRYTTHILFLLLVFGPRYKARLFQTNRLALQLVRALMMFIMPVSFIGAVDYMPVNNIMSIFWLSPLLILALSSLLLRERAGWLYWLSALALGAAVIAFLHPSWNITESGFLLALAMNLSFSLYLIMTRMLRDERTLTNLVYTAVGVLILLSFGLPAFWQPLTLTSGLMMAAVGLLGVLLLWALDKALEISSAARLAPFVFLQPLWTVLLLILIRTL